MVQDGGGGGGRLHTLLDTNYLSHTSPGCKKPNSLRSESNAVLKSRLLHVHTSSAPAHVLIIKMEFVTDVPGSKVHCANYHVETTTCKRPSKRIKLCDLVSVDNFSKKWQLLCEAF